MKRKMEPAAVRTQQRAAVGQPPDPGQRPPGAAPRTNTKDRRRC